MAKKKKATPQIIEVVFKASLTTWLEREERIEVPADLTKEQIDALLSERFATIQAQMDEEDFNEVDSAWEYDGWEVWKEGQGYERG